MKPTTTLITIPALSDSTVLAKWLKPGEPVVIVKMTGVGNNQPYTHRADDKAFVFRWSSDQQGHILRVPLGLWMQNKAKLAHELLDQRRASHALVVLFEMPAVAAVLTEPAESFTSPEMGAADTTPAQNVVGLSEGPTVAPAEETAEQVEERLADQNDSLIEEENAENEQIRDQASSQADTAALSDLAYDLTEAPKRIKALAALLGVEESTLREAVESPSSKVELAAAGWVRRKESPSA